MSGMVFNLENVVAKEKPLEQLFDDQLKEAGFTGYERNVTFIPNRRFKADFWFKDLRLAVEVDGGIFMKRPSGHTTGVGYHSDRVRDQLALASGITTIRFTTPQVRNGEGVKYLQAYFPVREKEVAAFPKMSFRADLPPDYGQNTKQKKKRGGK